MKTAWMTTLLCATVLLAVGGRADALDVRIQLRDQRVLAGQLTGRVDGNVLFRQSAGEEPVRVPDTAIQQIQFRVSSEENARIARFYDAREFRTIAEPLVRMLTPLLPYAGLPSNQTENFLRWMVVSYWVGEPERTLELAQVMSRFPEPFGRAAAYYRGLAQAETGHLDAVAALLASDRGNELYEPGSAARMYLEARIKQHEGRTMEALRTAAAMMAAHSRSTEWMPRVELLCAELYFELGRMDSAQGVLDDIAEFYDDPMIQKRAAALAARHNQTERGP